MNLEIYPQSCRKNIKRLISAVGMSAETAYSMMLMNAALMDLHPDDPRVADYVLADCGIFPEQIS